MSDAISYRAVGAHPPGRTAILFAHTMGYVAVTTALFAAGAYLGRDLSYGAGLLLFFAAFGCLIGMRFALTRSRGLTVGLLAAFGVLMGLATAPTLAPASAPPVAPTTVSAQKPITRSGPACRIAASSSSSSCSVYWSTPWPSARPRYS